MFVLYWNIAIFCIVWSEKVKTTYKMKRTSYIIRVSVKFLFYSTVEPRLGLRHGKFLMVLYLEIDQYHASALGLGGV